MLTGIRVEIEGDEVVLAATDRFRLAVRKLAWEPTHDDVSGALLVPARTLSDAAKTFVGASDTPVALELGKGSAVGGEGLLGIVNGPRRTTTRLLDAEFPKFRQLLPKEHTSVATVDVAELADAIKRVALLAERGAQVRLEFSGDGLRLTAGGEDAGQAEEWARSRVPG